MIRPLLLALIGLVLATGVARMVIDAGRLAMSVLFAGFVGVMGGTVAGIGAGDGAIGALVGFGSFVTTLMILRRRDRVADVPAEAPLEGPLQRWRRRLPRRLRGALAAEPRLAAAWYEAEALAGPGDHRVARAHESCDALAEAAGADPLDADLRDCAAMIAHSVPGIVDIARREAAGAPVHARAARIEEMIELLDQLGDDADRARARARRPGDSPYAVHRAYLDARRREAGGERW